MARGLFNLLGSFIMYRRISRTSQLGLEMAYLSWHLRTVFPSRRFNQSGTSSTTPPHNAPAQPIHMRENPLDERWSRVSCKSRHASLKDFKLTPYLSLLAFTNNWSGLSFCQGASFGSAVAHYRWFARRLDLDTVFQNLLFGHAWM